MNLGRVGLGEIIELLYLSSNVTMLNKPPLLLVFRFVSLTGLLRLTEFVLLAWVPILKLQLAAGCPWPSQTALQEV